MAAVAFNITVGRMQDNILIPLAIFANRRIAHAYATEGSKRHPNITFYLNYQPQHKTSIGITHIYQNGVIVNN